MSAAPATRSLLVEILASGARHVASIVSGIATVALVAHRLGPASLGAWTILGSTSFLLGLSDLGLSTAVARALAAEDRPRARRAVGVALWLIAAIFPLLSLLSLAGVTGACMAADGRGLGFAILVILVTVAAGLTGAVAFPFRAFALMGGGMRGLATSRALGAGVQVAGVVGGLLLTRSLLAPALALLAGMLVETLLVIRTARVIDPRVPLAPIRPDGARELAGWLREGGPTLALNVAVILAIRVDVLVLARVAPLAAVAAYGVAARAVDQCFALAKQVSAALQPRLGAAATRREAIALATPLLFGLVASGLTALGADGHAALAAWAGPVVAERSFDVALYLLAAAACFASVSEVACSALTLAARSTWDGALPIVVGTAINLLVSIGGARWFGAWSIAGGTVVGNAVTCSLAWRRALPFIGWTWHDLVRAITPGFSAIAGAGAAGALLAGVAGGGLAPSLACSAAATLVGMVAAVATFGFARRAVRRRTPATAPVATEVA